MHDPRFESIEARRENRVALYHIFREAFEKKTLAEWKPYLTDFPVSPVQSLVDVINDPQAEANNLFVPIDHPIHGRMKVIANTINLSETQATIRMPAQEFSQPTEEVLLELGYTWQDISRLKEEHTIP